MDVRVITREFGGGALTRAALSGTVPKEWYEQVPKDSDSWTKIGEEIRTQFTDNKWLDKLAPALFNDDASAAHKRINKVYEANGLVVTTGQQPGLFGGPMYTLSKALTALALADEIEKATGIPTAPIFWAATDDSDFVEANHTTVVQGADVIDLSMSVGDGDTLLTGSIPDLVDGDGISDISSATASLTKPLTGVSMAQYPLGEISKQYSIFAASAGSAMESGPLNAVKASYTTEETVGSAYVKLLRSMLEPLGISVLDAAHPAVREAGSPVLRMALQRATSVQESLAERTKAIDSTGEYKVQVRPVPNLSLVFDSTSGERKRIPIKLACKASGDVADDMLSPNVLLRPIVERSILPTITYIGGPAEYAYFAQVTAIAEALELPSPRVVPRWSGMLIEPDVQEILSELNIGVDDFQDPHAVEGKIARSELPDSVKSAIHILRESVAKATGLVENVEIGGAGLNIAVTGFKGQFEHRINRLERRYAAAVKRSGNESLAKVATARAALFPNGIMQERVRNILPVFARYGYQVRDKMLEQARIHAKKLVSGD